MWKLGIDLGSESVKIACLSQSRHEFSLVSYGLFYREHVESIRETLMHPNFKGASIRVSLKDSLIKIRKLELPKAPEDDLKQMVKMALLPHLAEPPDNYILQYQPLQKLVFISERKQIEDYLLELKAFGIHHPAILEPRMNASVFAALHNYPLNPEQRIAIVDIGKSSALFSVISSEGLLFGRNLSEASGDDLFKQIPATKPELLTFKNPDIKEAMIQWLYKVAIEIQNSIENYQIQFPKQTITELLLTGGACKISELSNYIQDTLKIQTTFLHTFKQINTSGFPQVNFENQEHFYATAIGLAL